jgi:hypothetical protein
MLKNRIYQLFAERKEEHRDKENMEIELYPEEIWYLETHKLIPEEIRENITLVEKNEAGRFSDIYIERCNKDSDQLISEEGSGFLKQPIEFLKSHKNEFFYIESQSFDLVETDAISLEIDDVFGTYDVMLGLKLQKKYDSALRGILEDQLSGEHPKFDLMFNREDGLWDLNFTLNYAKGFREDLTIGEACQVIYHFLFTVLDLLESDEK